jgi:pSer/pThr/pTyr-binding forkhead associated (FHA) protein
MKLSLVVLTAGKQEGKVLPITLSQFLIGRDPQCHLRPASASISKRHCALIVKEGKAFVRDFDSTNGTFLNGQPVKGEVEVKHDDRLRVGPLEFALQIEATPVNKPTPAPATRQAAATKQAGPKPADKTPVPATRNGGGESDEDIAAMLLTLDDGDSPSGDVPEGSTVHDIPVPSLPGEEEGAAKKDDKPKPPPNTSNAAKEILEKYMRRPR